MWWIGFRQIYTGTTQARVYQPGWATVLGPYSGRDEAKSEIRSEWDARYSGPFEAETKALAEGLVESMTPKR